MKKILGTILLAISLGACTPVPVSPTAKPVFDNVAAQRTVLKAEGDYLIAVTIADTYVNLPLCSDTVKQPCATLTLVRQIQKAQPLVRAALNAAKSATLNKSFGADIVNSSVIAATSSLSAFTAITKTLKGN